jgi:hypothetical protein
LQLSIYFVGIAAMPSKYCLLQHLLKRRFILVTH